MFVWFNIVDIVEVRGTSMSPTLYNHQVVLVNRAAYGVQLFGRYFVRWRNPEIGDIVVYRSPLDNNIVVKRCVANGNNTLFLVGDNLDTSIDSRHYGTVSSTLVYGKVLHVK